MKYVIRMCSLILVMTMVIGMIPAAFAAGHPFRDVPAGSWYDAPVAFCYENGLMAGTSSATFDPDAAMSRAMLVTVLHRMDGSPEPAGQMPFADVANDTWFTKAVAWAYAESVVNGTSATKFSPNDNVSREQLVTIFYRYAKSEGYDVSKVVNLSSYADNGRVSNYAKEAFSWAVANGIIQGTSATQLSPAGTATRAQCATIIQRFVKWTEVNSNVEDPTDPTTETTHTHEFKAGEVVAPTCEAEGYTIYACSCGATEKRDIKPVTEHSYDTLTDSKEPTCTEAGYKIYSCTCGKTTQQTVSAVGHSWGEWITTKEPTASENGEQTRTCSICGETENTTISSVPTDHEHDFGAWTVVYPTCISEGYEYRTCECGFIQNGATFPIKDHDWSAWTTVKEPTTSEVGSAKRICSMCKTEEYKELPKHVHSFGSWIKVAASCTEEGYYYHTCACGETERGNTIAKKDHNYELISSVDASCTEAGINTYKCTVCPANYTEDIDMLEHEWEYTHTDETGHWGDYVLVCTCGWSCSENEARSAGFRTVGKYWAVNHADYYSSIGATNDHSYDTRGTNWSVDTPATDTWTCSGCGASTTNHDEVTGHSMISAKGYSTCFDCAEEVFVCTVCDYSYTTTFQESLGHTWGEWTIVEEPSESSRGWATRTCTFEYHNGMICGYTMGDYADLVNEGQHYHSYKPESLTVCIECGEDSVPD